MSIVIVDTSTLQYLYQLRLIHLLHDVLGPVVVPQAVADEIAEGHRIGIVLPHLGDYGWLTVVRVKGAAVLPLAWDLGRGEREVLALALEQPDARVVLDDGPARRAARLLGIPVVGTLGILLKAKQMGLISAVAPILDQLNALNFRVDSATWDHVLRLAGEDRN